MGGRARGDSVAVPVPRPPAREDAPERRAPFEGHLQHSAPHERARLPGDPDTDPHLELTRGGARLSRPEQEAPWKVLRPPAGAATVQAVADGGGIRPLLPDRAVLSR